jgi:hypothetical protein
MDKGHSSENSSQDPTPPPPISTNSGARWNVPVIPNYMGDWEGKDHSSRPEQAKEFVRPPSQQKKTLGTVAHTRHPNYSRKHKIGRLQSRSPWAKSKTLSPRWPEQKGLEPWLPCKHKLNWNPKKKKKILVCQPQKISGKPDLSHRLKFAHPCFKLTSLLKTLELMG